MMTNAALTAALWIAAKKEPIVLPELKFIRQAAFRFDCLRVLRLSANLSQSLSLKSTICTLRIPDTRVETATSRVCAHRHDPKSDGLTVPEGTSQKYRIASVTVT